VNETAGTAAATKTTLRHGYTLADFHRLATNAVLWDFWHHRGVDFQERRELAWSAIAECLYASDEAPSRHELITAGQRAIGEQVRADCVTRGIASERGYIVMPHFWRYWYQARPTQGPEERVVDRLALAQIWDELSSGHQQVLLALAAHDDHDRAARSLGLTRSAYRNRLSMARQAFYLLWHEGEQPSRIWARDYRGGKGVNSESRTTGIIRRRQRERHTRSSTEDTGPRP
jgi:hypothetical protein